VLIDGRIKKEKKIGILSTLIGAVVVGMHVRIARRIVARTGVVSWDMKATSALFWYARDSTTGFLLQTGEVGEVHVFDKIAFSYNTLGVTLPPKNVVMYDSILNEALAYFMQFLCTGVFGLMLWKKIYSPSRAKKSEMSPTCWTNFLSQPHLLFMCYSSITCP